MNNSSRIFKILLSTALFLLLRWPVFAQFSLYLIGDAGKYANLSENPALVLLEEKLNQASENSAVVYLGDNIYNSGLEEGKQYGVNVAKIEAQMNILRKYKGSAYFVPGNHDWQTGKEGGLEVIRNQAEYVDSFVNANTPISNRETGAFYPKNAGLPGPDTLRLQKNILLLLFDSQWFIHKRLGRAVAAVDGSTVEETETIFWASIMDILSAAKKKGDWVVMVSHHPLYSIGPHGEKGEGHDALNLIGRYNSQEIYGKGYLRFRDRMAQLLKAYPETVIYATGHDHNLQYWRDNQSNHIVLSGAGSKHSGYYPKSKNRPWNQGASLIFPDASRYPAISDGKNIPEEEVNMGFFRIDFGADRKVTVVLQEVGREGVILR